MSAGKALGTLAVALILSTCFILTLACGLLAGGAIGFLSGGAAGWAGNWGVRLPVQRWLQVSPTPRLQQLPRATPTPLPLTPRRTPQAVPNVTPQAPRAPFPAGESGAIIRVVDADSAAERAGLQVGDLITQVDAVPVDENHTLSTLIQAKKPGDKVTLTVMRGSQTRRMDVTLGARKLASGDEVASLGVTYAAWPLAGTGPAN